MTKKIICLIVGHNVKEASDKDMFGYTYVWQKKYCNRCGKRMN